MIFEFLRINERVLITFYVNGVEKEKDSVIGPDHQVHCRTLEELLTFILRYKDIYGFGYRCGMINFMV
jgi:hypothetical protein